MVKEKAEPPSSPTEEATRKVSNGEVLTSQLFLDSVIECSPIPMWLAHPDGTLFRTNQALCEMLGVTAEQLTGKYNVFEDGNVSKQDILPQVLDVFERNRRTRFTMTWRSADVGTESFGRPLEMQIDVSMYPILNPDGEQVCVVAQWMDITERTEAVAALSESEARFRGYVGHAPYGIFIADHAGKYVDVNPEASRITGYSREELLTMSIPDLLPPERKKQSMATFRKLPKEGKYRTEGSFIHKNGERREWTVTAVRLTEDRFLGFVEDVTERIEAEQALRRSESTLKRVFETLPVGLWFADRDGRLLQGNPAGIAIWGAEPHVSPADYGMFKARRLPSGEEIGTEDWALLKTIRNGDRISDEILEIDAFDGQKRTIVNHTAPIFDEEGTVQGAIVVNQDITELRELQDQLAQSQRLESVGHLAGGVAHDFNNLLMGIMNYVELCRDEVGPEHPARRWLDEIMQDAERSAAIIRQLLAFARKQVITPKVINVNKAVAGVLRMLQRLIGENIKLVSKQAPCLWNVRMDPAQLDQIFANLAVNARDAINGAGQVTVETENMKIDEEFCRRHPDAKPGCFVRISVSDNGCGMPAETLEHVFEPFFTTKENAQGTGLGLATVYGIVKQNNGFIIVDSEVGYGTIFRIYLPRHEGKTTVTTCMKNQPSEAAGGSETILLVEDERSVRMTAQLFLQDLGYNVLIAEEPTQAIHQAIEYSGDIHLLLSDVVMPNMDGRELAGELLVHHPSLKIIFMSGYTDDVIFQRAMVDKGVAFLAKPFSRLELASKVRQMLDA